MRFIIFVIDEPGNRATPEEMQEIDKFNEKLQREGHWVLAAGIAGSDAARIIDNRSWKNSLTEGSLVDGKENYSGFWIIDVTSAEVAQTLAMEGSYCCNRRVELRPYL